MQHLKYGRRSLVLMVITPPKKVDLAQKTVNQKGQTHQFHEIVYGTPENREFGVTCRDWIQITCRNRSLIQSPEN